jgi:hypothetical protein
LYPSHSSDTGRYQRRHGVALDPRELAAEVRDMPVRFPQLRIQPFDRKFLQRHDGLLAYSAHGEAKLTANLRRRLTDAEENGRAAMARSFSHELAHEVAPAREGSNRIAQHDPAPPDNAEHHEAIAGRMEEKAFVSQQSEAGSRLRRLCDDLGSPRQGVSTRGAGHHGSGSEQAEASCGKSCHGDCYGGPQGARSIAIEREMPPQLVAVADLLVRE